MALALALRSKRDSLFRIGVLSNKPLIAAVALTFGLQLSVVYLPLLQGYLRRRRYQGVISPSAGGEQRAVLGGGV
jgi:Cation transporting ATPase, C-terminus